MKIQIEFENQTYFAEAQNIRGETWVHFNGQSFIYQSERKLKSKRKSVANRGSGNILAPMPGKITRIIKSLHEQVLIGEPILVMEAMKMEYTLKADLDGQVSKLICQVGDQVALGQSLVLIKAPMPAGET